MSHPPGQRFSLDDVQPFLKSDIKPEDIQLHPHGTPTMSLQQLLDNAYQSNVLATVPGLVLLKCWRDLTFDSIVQKGWHLEPEKSPVYHLMPEIVATNGKLQVLKDILRRFGSETDRCRVYRLIAPESVLEQSIIDDQKLQLEHAWMSEYDLDGATAKNGLESRERQQDLSRRLEMFVFGDAEEEALGT